jgi:hypothetical protein
MISCAAPAVVLPDRRQGHNRCRALAPKTIDADDRGFARIKGAGFVLAAFQKARLAVKVQSLRHALSPKRGKHHKKARDRWVASDA